MSEILFSSDATAAGFGWSIKITCTAWQPVLDGVSDEEVGARLADHVRISSIAMFIGVRPCPRCPPPRSRYVTVRQSNESADAEDDPHNPDDEIPF